MASTDGFWLAVNVFTIHQLEKNHFRFCRYLCSCSMDFPILIELYNDCKNFIVIIIVIVFAVNGP